MAMSLLTLTTALTSSASWQRQTLLPPPRLRPLRHRRPHLRMQPGHPYQRQPHWLHLHLYMCLRRHLLRVVPCTRRRRWRTMCCMTSPPAVTAAAAMDALCAAA